MKQIDRDLIMSKILLEVTDLSSTTSGSVLSEVDMVGLVKYLNVVTQFNVLREGQETRG